MTRARQGGIDVRSFLAQDDSNSLIGAISLGMSRSAGVDVMANLASVSPRRAATYTSAGNSGT